MGLDLDLIRDKVKELSLLSAQTLAKLTTATIKSIMLEYYSWQYMNQRYFKATALNDKNFNDVYQYIVKKTAYDRNIIYAVFEGLIAIVRSGKIENKFLQPKKDECLEIMKQIDTSYLDRFLKNLTDIGQNALEEGYKKIVLPIILIGALMGGIYAYGKSK
jgi:hypothetical protein